MISFESFIMEDGMPIYLQIILFVKRGIIAGVIADGEELPSRRVLSALLGVNPNTVQKSFEQLDQKGIIYSVRGSGWYVSAETQTAKDEVSELIRSKTADYFGQMNALGMDNSETKRYVKEWNTNE